MKVKWLPVIGLVATLGCGSGGGGDDEGGDDRIDAGSQPGGPAIASLTVNRASITEGGAVTFTAIVTDPDGLEDIAGGSLALGSATAPFGAFVQQTSGTYTIEVTWSQIAAARPIEFTADETRAFRAEFIDRGARRGWQETTLVLTCDGDAACDSTCVDLERDASHCGTCDNACRVEGESGGCSAGTCQPALTTCMSPSAFATCNAACAAQGETCATCGGVSSMYYDSRSDCAEQIVGSPGPGCDAGLGGTPAESVRCCCTSAP
jgi:hypothetical protein